MPEQQHERLSELLHSRERAESHVNRIQQQANEAVENGHLHERLEQMVTSCKDAMTNAIKRLEQILALTQKIDYSASLLKEQENWLNVVLTTDDQVLKRSYQ